MKNNSLDTFKSHLIRLIKEELESGEDEKQAGLEKAIYDTVLAPSDVNAAVEALQNSKNYGIYAKNLTDRNEYNLLFGPSNPPQKANAAWKDWDSMFPKPNDDEDQVDSLLNKRLQKIKLVKNNNPEDWEKLKDVLSDKFKDYSIETGDDSFEDFIASLPSTELRFEKGIPFFGKSAGNYFLAKNLINTNRYTGIFKDDQYQVVGDKIIFPQKKNPFETKDYLEKVLKTIMGNAKIQYTLSQQESGDQPKTTSNTQGKVEKINFVKTFDSPELAAKFKRLIPKDFAEKTTVEGGKITVADITDPQKKNLMATALKFVADNAPKKKPMKESNNIPEVFQNFINDVNNLKEPGSDDFDLGVKGYYDSEYNIVEVYPWAENWNIAEKVIDKLIKEKYPIIKKFNMAGVEDALTYKLNKVQMKESVKDQIKKAIEEVIREKKLTKAEINKKEDIVKAMKGTTKLPDPAIYAIATDKAKKLAEEEEKTPLLLPSNILTKVNSKVVNPKTFAEFLIGIYNQIQKGETIDFSQNQNFKRVIDYLNRAKGEKPGATQPTTSTIKPTTTAPNTPPSLK